VTGVCDGKMTQCWYCKNMDNNNCNMCTPGCMNDYSNGTAPSCPLHKPKCNVDVHRCDAEPGHTLLTSIVVATRDCQNCEGGSAVFDVTGDTAASNSEKQCITGKDWRWTDWSAGLQASYSAGDRSAMNVSDPTCRQKESTVDLDNGWGTCACHPLDGLVTKLEARWKGPGTWTPDTVCFDWHKPSQFVTLCTYNDSTSSSSVHQFDCERLDTIVDCH